MFVLRDLLQGTDLWDCWGWQSNSEIYRTDLQEGQAGTLEHKEMEAAIHR